MPFPCALRTSSGATPGKDACCAAGVGGVMIGDSDLNGSQKIFTTFCARRENSQSVAVVLRERHNLFLSLFLTHNHSQQTLFAPRGYEVWFVRKLVHGSCHGPSTSSPSFRTQKGWSWLQGMLRHAAGTDINSEMLVWLYLYIFKEINKANTPSYTVTVCA